MNLLNKFLEKSEFTNYDDFYQNFKIRFEKDFCFAYDVVDEYARLQPDKMALVWCDDIGNEKTITFGEMKKLSDKTANFLIQCGIRKGDRVMTMLMSRYEYWYVLVALNKIGAIIIPATHLLTQKDIEYRCNIANIRMLISVNKEPLATSIEKAMKKCPSVICKAIVGHRDGWLSLDDGVANASDQYPPTHTPSAWDDMLMYFTSGTTGQPKIVLHKNLYALGHIITAKYWHNVVEDGLHFTVADTGWAKASWGKSYGQWIAGSAVFAYDFQGKFTPNDFVPVMHKYNITTFCAPPTVYRFFIKENITKETFSTISYFTTAGEPLNPEVYKQFFEATGKRIFEGFGQTETTMLLGTTIFSEPHVGSTGLLSPLYDVRLLDNNDNEVSPGEEGEICIRIKENQIGLFYGYYGDEAKTKSCMYNGYYHTGDLAYRDNEGYFWFVGRKDDIIKSSGYRIGPFEVESALLEHPAVLECAITGVPDELRGQVVKATVVLTKNYTPSEELKKELQNHVKKTTAPYKYPRIVEFVDALPKTISGKIRRIEIRGKKEPPTEG